MPIIIDLLPPTPPTPPSPDSDTEAYLALFTSEHNKKPKLVSTATTLLSPTVATANTIRALPADFDLDTAIGAQLDVVGEWVGLSRHVPVALENVYFSLDVEGLGLDQGSLQGPNDPDTGLVTLPDDTYRQFLRIQIAKNQWNGTISQAVEILNTVLTGQDVHFVLQDGGDMSMTEGLIGNADAVVRALFANGFMDFKPAGVRINRMIADGPLFGLDVQNSSVAGLDAGAFSTI